MNINKENLLNRKFIININNKITKKQLTQIDNVCRFYDSCTIRNRLKNIIDFIEYGVEDHWCGRLRIIQKKLKNDGFSEYALKIKYGDNWELIKNKRYSKVNQSLASFIERYGESLGTEKWNQKCEKNKSYGLKYMVNRYGSDLGTEKWNNTLLRKINTMKERKTKNPYRNGRTLVEYQNRYGMEMGYSKWLERNKKQKYRFSKKYYIDLYGKNNGSILWLKYKSSMDKTSLKAFIKRYGEIDGIIKYQEYCENNYKFYNFYSKSSQKLFWGLVPHLDKKKCKFAELNGEQYFYINQPWAISIFVDFKYDKFIIEYDGDYWHRSTKIVDKLRDQFLIDKGYKVLRITESEYSNNIENTIKKCINFLNET